MNSAKPAVARAPTETPTPIPALVLLDRLLLGIVFSEPMELDEALLGEVLLDDALLECDNGVQSLL